MPGSTSVDADGKHPRPVRGPTTRPSATLPTATRLRVDAEKGALPCRAGERGRPLKAPSGPTRRRIRRLSSPTTVASKHDDTTTAQAGILDPAPSSRRRGAGWAWFAGGDGFVLAIGAERGELPERAGHVGRRDGGRQRLRDDRRGQPVVEHVDRERALGAAALGRALLPDRAARPEELRHEPDLEPRASRSRASRSRSRSRSSSGCRWRR